jgi:endogenous inhibitor of DNA gyrase (YacG/DUF329 family)
METTTKCPTCGNRLAWRNGADYCINCSAAPKTATIKRPIKTWPRASNMRRERTCALCKLPMGWDDKYRDDTRTQVVWHVACEAEQARRFAKLEPWLAKLPTVVPTFPKAIAGA